jgi:hypothetical protein
MRNPATGISSHQVRTVLQLSHADLPHIEIFRGSRYPAHPAKLPRTMPSGNPAMMLIISF